MTTLSIPEPVTGPFLTPPSLLSASPAPSPVRLQGNLSHYHSLGPLSTLLSLTSRSLTYVFCFSWLAANIEPIPFQMYHPPNGPLVLLRILHSCLLKSLSNSLWTSHSTPSLSADDFMPCFAQCSMPGNVFQEQNSVNCCSLTLPVSAASLAFLPAPLPEWATNPCGYLSPAEYHVL